MSGGREAVQDLLVALDGRLEPGLECAIAPSTGDVLSNCLSNFLCNWNVLHSSNCFELRSLLVIESKGHGLWHSGITVSRYCQTSPLPPRTRQIAATSRNCLVGAARADGSGRRRYL